MTVRDLRRNVSAMGKPLRCRLGMHAYVKKHPTEPRSRDQVHAGFRVSADREVCRLCGKSRSAEFLPPGLLGG